jgi:uncharacterized Ntn-hydrolase superfamily protein
MLELPVVATFSIVGRDPATGEMGVAVQSKFLSVGSVVPWAAYGAGAIATQAWAKTSFGPDGLELLRQGLSAPEVLDRLIAADPGASHRQVGIVDMRGGSATYTGKDCLLWAGGVAGENFAAQGNILVDERTVAAMAESFRQSEGDLAHRLCEALDGGQAAGGDSRGRQSAALYIVKENGGYGARSDRHIDLRVDDHPEPIQELKRLLALWRLYMQKPETLLKLEDALEQEVSDHLRRLGYLGPDVPFADAWRRFVGTENLEERDVQEGFIDPVILDWLRRAVSVK